MIGIDVSDFQPNIDFAKVARSGVSFVYSKASEGTGFIAQTFKRNHDACKENGIPFGAYHFWRAELDPIAQADYFLAAIDGYEGQLLPMVDVELSGGVGSSALVEKLAAFNDRIEANVGKRIVIYTGYAFWNEAFGGSDAFAGHPLWVAEYNDGAIPSLPNGWHDWTLWQYTDHANVDGILGGVDMERLNGSNLSIITR